MSRRLVAYFWGEDPVERRFLLTVNAISILVTVLAYAA